MPSDANLFSKDYAEARYRFRTAAMAANCQLECHAIDAKAPDGGELTIDVACWDGPGLPERVMIVTSGLHGTEGLFGSAVQLAWLRTEGKSWRPPAGVRLVMAHALNPYGFAWRRRWDENSIDLNRNYLVDRSFLTTDANYAQSRQVYTSLDPFLNPPSPPSRFEPYAFNALRTILASGREARRQLPTDRRPLFVDIRAQFGLGLRRLRTSLPVGQYEHPQGLFFGGHGPAQTTRILQSRLPEWVGSASFAVHIDLHTGLGRRADYKLLLDTGPGTETARWSAKCFGVDVVEPVGGETAYAARGSIGQYFQSVLKDCRYRYLCAEFGTYSPMRVLGALRAENRAHHHGRNTGRSYEWTKRNVVEVFCPTSPAWRATVLNKGLEVLRQAFAVTTSATASDP